MIRRKKRRTRLKMERFLADRRSDPKFKYANSRVTPSGSEWYKDPPRFRGETVTHTFAAKKEEKEEKKDSDSSESDGEGGRRKKQRKGTCWEGYHRVEGTKQYEDGSCEKD